MIKNLLAHLVKFNILYSLGLDWIGLSKYWIARGVQTQQFPRAFFADPRETVAPLKSWVPRNGPFLGHSLFLKGKRFWVEKVGPVSVGSLVPGLQITPRSRGGGNHAHRSCTEACPYAIQWMVIGSLTPPPPSIPGCNSFGHPYFRALVFQVTKTK